MRIKFSIIVLLSTIIIVCQATSGYAEISRNVFEVKTHYGTFPLQIPSLRLPELPKLTLVSVEEASLPELGDWHYSRFIPENPSWLDRAGKYYKEGIVHLFRGDLNVAMKRFQAVTDDYPETIWFAQSWFWQGQISAKQGKYIQAGKILTFFLDSLEQSNNSARFLDYQNISRYTIVWLAIKQKKYQEAQGLIKKYESKISVNQLLVDLLYLKYLTHVKLKQSNPIFVELNKLIQDNPYEFGHLVRLAEFYFVEKRWQELSNLVSVNTTKKTFYNEPQMEHFLWLGVVAEMSLKQWSKAKRTIKYLEDLGVRSQDQLARALLQIHIEAKQFELAWEKWLEIEDDRIREQTLRAMMHHASQSRDNKFLQLKLPELKSVSLSWKAWRAELELIYSYLYLSLGQRKKAKQWLKWSFKNSLPKEDGQLPGKVHEESLFLLAVVDLLSEDYENAFTNLKELLENYSSSVRLSDYYFWYGVMLYEIEKRHLDAIMAMRQVDQEGERDDDRWYLQGKVNHDLQRWSPAIFAFSTLKKRHPGSEFLEESLYLHSDSYYEQKQYNSALEILDDLYIAFESLKKPVRAVQLRVRILVALQRYEKADDVLRRNIAQYSDFSLIKLRVEVLKHIKDPRRILNVTGIGLGLSTSEDHGFLFFHRANALYDTEKYEEAITYYNLALKNPPKGSNRIIRFRILKIQFVLARIPEMLKGANIFLKVNNEDVYSIEILHLLAAYYLEKKKNEKAFPYLKQLIINYKKSVRKIELSPEKRVEQIVLIGELYNELTNYEMAEIWLNQALKTMETVKDGRKKWQLKILREKGLALFEQHKHKQSLSDSLKVLYLDRNLPEQKSYELNLRIASSYIQLERSTDAIAVYRKMLKKFKTEERQLEVENLIRDLTE